MGRTSYNYEDRQGALYDAPVESWEDWKRSHPMGTKKEYYRERDILTLDAELNSGLSHADRKIQEQNRLIQQEKKLRPGVLGTVKMGLNKLKNRILHPIISRDLEDDAALQDMNEQVSRMRAKQDATRAYYQPPMYASAYGMGMVPHPMMAPMYTSAYGMGMVPTAMPAGTTINTATGMPIPQGVRYGSANDIVSGRSQYMYASFTPKQKSYWGKIMAFSGATPYSANNPQVKEAIAQANEAQAQADKLRAQAQTTQAQPPDPVLYPTQPQTAPQYTGEAYAQPQQYTSQPNLAPGTNQLAIRAQTDPMRRPTLLDDAKAFIGRTGDKIGAYLDSRGIDRNLAKNAAIATALGTLGISTIGQTLSKKKLKNENDELKARIEELEAKLSSHKDRNTRSSHKKKRQEEYYDDDEDDGAEEDNQSYSNKKKKRNNNGNQNQQYQLVQAYPYGAIPMAMPPVYTTYANNTSQRNKRNMKSQVGKNP